MEGVIYAILFIDKNDIKLKMHSKGKNHNSMTYSKLNLTTHPSSQSKPTPTRLMCAPKTT
jgi:hypothetical protein